MELIWSANAIEDLRSIYLFYFYKNHKAAERIYTTLISEVDRLVNFPDIGKKEISSDEEEWKYRALFVRPYYKVFYKVENEQVIVIAVWDCRQDPENLQQIMKIT
ncbi:MAG: type II toxin-antitoxin system RelE/ParE family toxin [Tannerellaceae bacterium]|nr:type II toxin-antitoxin system RelE/ParE family toxin [Tannerellaceae bacterium]